MSARQSLAEVFGEGGHGDNSQRFADELYAQIRAEVIAKRDAQVIAWLVKKAREYGTSNRDARAKAEAVGRMADKLSRGAVRPSPEPPAPADVTVYRAEHEHEPFLPIGLYSNEAAARAHCEHLVRQEWTPSTPLTFEWSVDEDEPEVIELDVRVEADSWSTGYTVKTVVANAEFDPEADS